MKSSLRQLNLELINASNYREFILIFIRELEISKGRGARAEISRKAGFASRSYLSEILQGQKGLSRDAMIRFKVAMKLTSDLGKLFELLVYKCHPNLQLTSLPLSEIEKKIASTRKKILSSQKRSEITKPFVSRPEVFQVYAALGTEFTGANFDEIRFRTQASERDIKSALQVLLSGGAVQLSNERYFAVTSKASFLNCEEVGEVTQMVQRVCRSIQTQSRQIVEDPKNLNIYSAFSIHRSRIPELKKEFQQAFEDILEKFQDDEGDAVEQVFISLFRTPFDGKNT
ncbi:MAG: DUF4423 domain-containing protein [Pseudobdellovibrionaceae bacterium]